MRNRRAKLMTGATVIGLGALGGVALGTNHGLPASPTATTGGASAALVTSASGTTQPVLANSPTSTRPPIVTRAGGGAAPLEIDD